VETDGGHAVDLYNVDIEGGTPRLHIALPAGEGGLIMDAQITPDSTRVIYAIKFDDLSPVILYSAPVAGGMGDELTPMGLDRAGISHFKISPDSAYVVYSADKLNNDAVELYSVTISGAANVRINPALLMEDRPVF